MTLQTYEKLLVEKFCVERPISVYQKKVHETAVNAGWWDDPAVAKLQDAVELAYRRDNPLHMHTPVIIENLRAAVAQGFPRRNVGEMLALVHSEVSEALEEWRTGRMDTEVLESGKRIGFYSELAGCVIRIMDIFEEAGKSLEEEIWFNNEYNRTRPHRHGGKLA